MEESQSQVQVHNDKPSYWESIAIAGVIFGIIVFALTLISSYTVINSKPTGSYFSASSLIGILVCLIGAFGGMLATWHYAKEYNVGIKLGRGALIGFLTGILIVIISTALSHIWQLIDPDMTQKMIDSTIANFQAMDLPADKKQQLVDSMSKTMRNSQSVGRQLLWGIPMFGIVNLVTGMIGAKIFGKKEEEIL